MKNYNAQTNDDRQTDRRRTRRDALTLKIIEQVGFSAVYMTGYGQAASHLGKPDVGLLTLTEMVARASNIVEAVNVPVIADADTGFGNAVNVMRTLREYEKAGVAAIQLEDQVMAPKNAVTMTGRQVVSKGDGRQNQGSG